MNHLPHLLLGLAMTLCGAGCALYGEEDDNSDALSTANQGLDSCPDPRPIGSICTCGRAKKSCNVQVVAPPMSGKQVSVCVMGTDLGDPFAEGDDYVGNASLKHICARLPGIVTYGGNPGFRKSVNERDAADSVYKALVDAGIEVGDNVELNVVGYSWGAFTAVNIINKIVAQHPAVKVRRLITFDPYAVVSGRVPATLDVPRSVQYAFNIRHTITNARDKGFETFAGGVLDTSSFLGRLASVQPSTSCVSADLSGNDGPNSRWGHVDVPALCQRRGWNADAEVCTAGEYKADADLRSIAEQILDGYWNLPIEYSDACNIVGVNGRGPR